MMTNQELIQWFGRKIRIMCNKFGAFCNDITVESYWVSLRRFLVVEGHPDKQGIKDFEYTLEYVMKTGFHYPNDFEGLMQRIWDNRNGVKPKPIITRPTYKHVSEKQKELNKQLSKEITRLYRESNDMKEFTIKVNRIVEKMKEEINESI